MRVYARAIICCFSQKCQPSPVYDLCVDGLRSPLAEKALVLLLVVHVEARHRLSAPPDGGGQLVRDLALPEDLLEDADDVQVLFGGGLDITVAPVHAHQGLGGLR